MRRQITKLIDVSNELKLDGEEKATESLIAGHINIIGI